MRNGGGRSKGAGFENEIAKAIRAIAVDYGFGDDCCYRTPLSGGHRFAKKTDPGDLVMSPELQKFFPFHIECKKQEIFTLMHFITTKETRQSSWSEFAWLDQAVSAVNAAVPRRPPMVVMTKNRFPIYAAVPVKDWHSWNLSFNTQHENQLPLPNVLFHHAKVRWVLMPFDYVLTRIRKAIVAGAKK